MQIDVPTVHQEVIDGLTVLWVDTPPPLTAVLSFRVGVWDETLLTRGITHLVEHLAVYALRDVEYGFNGVVTGECMTLFAQGSDEQIVSFLATVSQELRALPVDRLKTEIGVLQAEARARGTGSNLDYILSVLYGPNGPGLVIHPERGFDCISAAEVQEWADRNCVLQNAVLMLSGKPPAGLTVDLPAGEHRPIVLPGDDVGYRPKALEFIAAQDSGIAMGALASRTTATVLGWEHLTHSLAARLRYELGLVYEVASNYVPLDRDTVFLYAAVDASAADLEQIASEFLATVREVRKNGPSPDALARLQRISTTNVDDATLARNELDRIGADHLRRYPSDPLDQLIAERLAATPEDVGAALRTATKRAAFVSPDLPVLGLAARTKRVDEPIAGKRFRLRHRSVLERLLVGPQGLSVFFDGRWLTFQWNDIVLAEKSRGWDLIHRNGSWITIDADDYWWRRKLARLLDSGIPKNVRFPRSR